ncbi:uncharacterized protein SAPINGB_P006124 [Magnusiomyces paraingens]|uniref:Uncharacterized protein n=1 Tax=Magnusiomyces paraingens TaxID=2606893 RepID=A0A5E8C3E7_9ASCO|nr:uncharacterized protein SAPINGB_P006124 [Saprochaete ingens]VVT58274.1 unnamed protein product [Saprochaete ingens]
MSISAHAFRRAPKTTGSIICRRFLSTVDSVNKSSETAAVPLTPLHSVPLPKDVILVSADPVTSTDKSDWPQIERIMRKYNDTHRYSDTLQLATRIEQLKLKPPVTIAAVILSALTRGHDMSVSVPAVLAIVDTVLEVGGRLGDYAERGLYFALRRCTDPLLRYALHKQCLRYFKEAVEPVDPPEVAKETYAIIQGNYVHGLLAGGEIEQAFGIFQKFSKEGMDMRKFPVESLVDRLIGKERPGSLHVYQDYLKNNNNTPGILTKALDFSAEGTNDGTETMELWADAVVSGKVEPSNSTLQRILENQTVGQVGSVYGSAFRRLSLQADHSQLSTGDVAAILTSLATSRTIRSSADFLPVLELCAEFWPDLNYKLLDAAMEALWCKASPGDHSQFYVPFIEYFPTISESDSPKFRTFLLNLVVRSHRQLWSPSASLYAFRAFLHAGVATPDASTFEELAASAMVMKHSKLLSLRIYEDCELFGITPTPRMYELLIRANARGRNLTSLLYFLSRVPDPEQTLPTYLKSFLYHQFERTHDKRYKELMDTPLGLRAQYSEFPSYSDLKASNSRPRPGIISDYSFLQDLAYSKNYLAGWPFEELPPPKV